MARIKSIVGIISAIAIIALALWYGFRTIGEDNSALGHFEYRYRWWRPYEIAVDSNRDGKVDARGFLESGETDFGGALREYWEDRDHDGRFEIHALFANGELKTVEVDDDQDGVYDREYSDKEAALFFQRFVEKNNRENR